VPRGVGQGRREQARRGENETGGVQQVDQGDGVVGGQAVGDGVGQDEPLRPGAVEQVEDPRGARIGHLDEDGPGRIEPQLQRVGIAPDAGQAGQEGGPQQWRSSHE
jgi:hypothetical protein